MHTESRKSKIPLELYLLLGYNEKEQRKVKGMTHLECSSTGELTNTPRYSIFRSGDVQIKFKTSPYLERYISISKWDNGYIECLAKYSTIPEPVEEYIDLRFVADRLRLPADVFLPIKEVKLS